jgi:hypothetical protein
MEASYGNMITMHFIHFNLHPQPMPNIDDLKFGELQKPAFCASVKHGDTPTAGSEYTLLNYIVKRRRQNYFTQNLYYVPKSAG